MVMGTISIRITHPAQPRTPHTILLNKKWHGSINDTNIDCPKMTPLNSPNIRYQVPSSTISLTPFTSPTHISHPPSHVLPNYDNFPPHFPVTKSLGQQAQHTNTNGQETDMPIPIPKVILKKPSIGLDLLHKITPPQLQYLSQLTQIGIITPPPRRSFPRLTRHHPL